MSISIIAALIGLALGWFALRTISRVVFFFLKPIALIVLGFALGAVSTLPTSEIRAEAILGATLQGAENLGTVLLTRLNSNSGVTPSRRSSWEEASKTVQNILGRGLESVSTGFLNRETSQSASPRLAE